eukprot:SM000114S24142  [mRNA]  locus=s114:180400:186654:+ [translate_table: standard]
MPGPGKALDPARWFIIVPNMLGNGLSSSPSNMPPPDDGPNFPPSAPSRSLTAAAARVPEQISVRDNVAAQHCLVTARFGIARLALVTGWSMAAAQAFQWAVSFPDMVPSVLPFCGSARTSPHNKVFLEGLRAALTADAAFAGGRYSAPPSAGLRAFARVYAGWGFSQKWYWLEKWRELGFGSLEDFLVGRWEEGFAREDANDLLAMLTTWQATDVGRTPGFDGDHRAALASIKARVIVMPAERDLYFPAEDSAYEAALIPHAELRVIPGVEDTMMRIPLSLMPRSASSSLCPAERRRCELYPAPQRRPCSTPSACGCGLSCCLQGPPEGGGLFRLRIDIVTWVFQEVSMLAVATTAAAAPAKAASRAGGGVELATDAAVAAPLRAGAAGGGVDKVLHLIRHGQTEMNVYIARAPAGCKDPLMYDTRLTTEGQRQARALAALAARRAPAPELIVTSPLTRALQTMELVFPAAKAPKVVEAAARERLYMASDMGRSPEVVAHEYPHLYFDHLPTIWWHSDERQDPLAVVMEPPDVFAERVSRFRKWLAARPEHTIAVVSHWGVLHQLTGRDFRNCELFTCRLSEIQNVRVPTIARVQVDLGCKDKKQPS